MPYYCKLCDQQYADLDSLNKHSCMVSAVGVQWAGPHVGATYDDRIPGRVEYRPPVRPEQLRGATHGDYGVMSQVIQRIKGTMRSGPAWERCSAGQKEALELMATKIGRIVCGDPNFHDHWDDIIGYCNKAVETIPRKATGG